MRVRLAGLFARGQLRRVHGGKAVLDLLQTRTELLPQRLWKVGVVAISPLAASKVLVLKYRFNMAASTTSGEDSPCDRKGL